jgi:hypothetical protein
MNTKIAVLPVEMAKMKKLKRIYAAAGMTKASIPAALAKKVLGLKK